MSAIEAAKYAAPVIKRFEGCHTIKGGLVYPYMCPAGYPTQGWGIVVPSMDVEPITLDEADRRFYAALPAYLLSAVQLSPILAQHPRRWGAIGSFVFNLGSGRYRASTLRKRVNEGDWDAAVQEILRWNRGGGRVLPGLVRRRNVEAEMLR